jgi:hypothetical protein
MGILGGLRMVSTERVGINPKVYCQANLPSAIDARGHLGSVCLHYKVVIHY